MCGTWLTSTRVPLLFAQMTETVSPVALVKLLVFAVGKMMHCEFKQCAIVIATGRTAAGASTSNTDAEQFGCPRPSPSLNVWHQLLIGQLQISAVFLG